MRPTNDPGRSGVVARLRSYLGAMRGAGRVEVRVPGQAQADGLAWSADAEERERTWPLVLVMVDGARGGGVVEAWPHNASVEERFTAFLPAMAAVVAPQLTHRLAAGAETLVAAPAEPALRIVAGGVREEEAAPEDAVPRPEKASEALAPKVLAALYHGRHRRMTAAEVRRAVGSAALSYDPAAEPPCVSSTEATLSWLRKLRLIDNRTDARGVGYGLADRDRIPAWRGEFVWLDEGD